MKSAQMIDQLMKYAADLNLAVRSERENASALVEARGQLLKFATDFNCTVTDLKLAQQEMDRAYLDTIHRLSLAAEYKDEDTGDHIVRMSRFCALIAEKCGLAEPEVQKILYAAPMHDIGKIGIPDSILLKKGRLTREEFDQMKTHTVIGAKILSNSKAEILQVAERIAMTHHEKWNGKGYPMGLAGDEIPIVGRITALPDTFDALTSRRPYKDPYPVEKAVDIIEKERGEHFDPDIVDIFLANLEEVLSIRNMHGGETVSDPQNFCLSERDRCVA
jgi:putative two-component system response regulator